MTLTEDNNLKITLNETRPDFILSIELSVSPVTLGFTYELTQINNAPLSTRVLIVFDRDIHGNEYEQLTLVFTNSPDTLYSPDYNNTKFWLNKQIETDTTAYKTADAAGQASRVVLGSSIALSFLSSILLGMPTD